MSTWQLVAGREMSAKLRDRNFIIGTLVMLGIIVASMVLPMLLMGSTTSSYTVATVGPDAARVVNIAAGGGTDDPSAVAGGRAEITARALPDRRAAVDAVKDGDADIALTHEGGRWQILAEGSPALDLTSALSSAIDDTTMAANAAAAGTTVEKLKSGTELVTVDLAANEATGDGSMRQVVAKGVGMGMAFLFYMAALMFGTQIAQSVVEEKQSRIVEILAAMIPLRQLLLGKVVGNTVMAFGQLLLMAGAALLGLGSVVTMALGGLPDELPAPGSGEAAALPVDVAGIATAIAWYVPLFIVGFVALACVWAAAGAMAGRNEDLQATTMPLTLSVMILFFLAIYSGGVVKHVLSFVPIASTIVMPMRLAEGDAAWWEPVVALALVAAFACVTVVFGARLYERAVMHTSGALGWRSALKLRG